MSEKKSKSNYEQDVIILAIVILLIILFIAMIVIFFESAIRKKNIQKLEEANVNVVYSEKVKESENEEELAMLQEMKERNRIEYYVSKFIRNVEEQNYEEAYKVLNKDFKKNYFPTIVKFKEYCVEKFSKLSNVEYNNFERNGTIYVIWMTVTDAIHGAPGSGEGINFVVKETDFNEYELSFSLKQLEV